MNRNQLARISDSYKSSLRRIAREKSRHNKPEDIAAQPFTSSILAAFVGMLSRFFSFFRHSKGTSPSMRRYHARGTPSNGFGQHQPILAGPPIDGTSRGRKNIALARSARRKLRRYCLRGYGYIAPTKKVKA
jgi:hypothetical protein